jgi:hypothetical protein
MKKLEHLYAITNNVKPCSFFRKAVLQKIKNNKMHIGGSCQLHRRPRLQFQVSLGKKSLQDPISTEK